MIKFESESALEQCFVDHYESTGMDPSNEEQWDKLLQQPNFGSYGRGDLLYSSLEPTDLGPEHSFGDRVKIVELKNEPLKFAHIAQVSRYYQYLNENTDAIGVSAALIVPSFDLSGDIVFLAQQIDWLEIYTFSMSFSGVEFRLINGYSPTKKNFPSKISEIESADYFEDSL